MYLCTILTEPAGDEIVFQKFYRLLILLDEMDKRRTPADRLDPDASRTALERLFTQRPVADLTLVGRTLGTDSRMSVLRRLCALGYLSSYTHTGRYYTLASIPQFDADGLWRWEQVGFSRHGTLKATVQRLVETSDAGCTQRELGRGLAFECTTRCSSCSKTSGCGARPLKTSTCTWPPSADAR